MAQTDQYDGTARPEARASSNAKELRRGLTKATVGMLALGGTAVAASIAVSHLKVALWKALELDRYLVQMAAMGVDQREALARLRAALLLAPPTAQAEDVYPKLLREVAMGVGGTRR